MDNDSDGLLNSMDIDDDNDGVLDIGMLTMLVVTNPLNCNCKLCDLSQYQNFCSAWS